MAGLVACLSTLPAAAQDVADPDTWLRHLTQDLLPFWSAAEGDPAGNFPGRLCNDGSLPTPGVACGGVSAWQASNPRRTLVAQSRQVFSYAVAFHMTGDTAWLDLARAGAHDQFDTFLNTDTGIFNEVYDVNTGDSWTGSGGANSQKQAYGLLGPTFLHYLTGDAELGQQIDAVSQELTATFRDPATGGWRAVPGAAGPGNRIVSHLDQLNAWQTLLAANAPLADREAIVTDALETARYLREAFYDPTTGLFRRTRDTPAGTLANADLGHSIKAAWFIDQSAKLAGDTELERFALQTAAGVLDLAWRTDGAWTTGYDAEGNPDDAAVWWSWAELDQYAASLAIERPQMRDRLMETQAYWLEHFVDDADGGIWGIVDLASNTPDTGYSKHWEWKAGFHSFEHALISYLSSSARQDGTAELFFARPGGVLPETLAYGFTADPFTVPPVSLFAAAESPVQRVELTGLTYGTAALSAVPVPAGAVLLLSALALLRLGGRRRPARQGRRTNEKGRPEAPCSKVGPIVQAS
ncbi:AGE family epimerase/isomerase [Roseisalinus antarcticus]|uniref:AGE family epimerase/isomerase n=1 Tax=Roseisalinus antarcticus TaxID=254357 RepID=UPI0013565965|nr:AGE family epimerase/isomerase [Roseisalinus antarcticus]